MAQKTGAAWPEGVIARYLTVGGATVDVAEDGDQDFRFAARCTGCSYTDLADYTAPLHRGAQFHAEKCRALPRPEAGGR